MSNPEKSLTPAEQLANASLNPSVQSQAMEPETDLWTGGFSPKAMIGTWLLSALFSVAVLVVLVMAPTLLGDQVPLKVLWSVGIGIVIAWWAIAISSYAYRRISVGYQLTNQRFIHKHGILVRTTDRIELIDIDDVAFSQGLIQRMLGVGTIRVTSSDRSHPTLALLGIDEVDRVSGMIDDARRKERRRRSLHIEAS
ncbi:MAG: PH domain-containing protein [Pirellula sp.]|jgi:membrane protein YdbS with pleckstrin-like domain